MIMEQLKQMIEFLDIHAGSLTFIVTFVYVVATIFICIANIRSAKATREQVAEQKRQFDESNRAYVTVHFEVTPSKLYTLCVCNHGNKVAKNVHLEISGEFIEELENDKVKHLLKNTKESKIDIGIGQKWYLWLGVLGDRVTMQKSVAFNLTYSDDNTSYNEAYNINLSAFNWQLLCSPDDKEYEQTKKIANSIDKISKSLTKIEREIHKEQDNG